MKLGLFIITTIIICTSACTKKEAATTLTPVPFSFTINSFTDSLSLIPINFSVTANQASGSYTWDFGDSSVAAGANVSHTYKKMGNYPINCYVKLGDQTYNAYTILHVKGDSRIIGTRHYSGSITTTNSMVVTQRTITDTIIEVKAPGAFTISWGFSGTIGLYGEAATQITYASLAPPYPASLSYFPNNDSLYLEASGGGGGYSSIYKFMSIKK